MWCVLAAFFPVILTILFTGLIDLWLKFRIMRALENLAQRLEEKTPLDSEI